MRCITPAKTLELERLLDSAGTVSVVVHTHPDGDAAGSGLALCSFLSHFRALDCRLILPDATPSSLDFLTAGAPVLDASVRPDEARRRIEASDLLFLLDLSRLDRSGALEESLRRSPAPKVLIDHHPGPEEGIFSLAFSETECSSTCEVLFYLLLSLKDCNGDAGKLPQACREALLTGLTTDTNNFANSVFPDTLRMVSALLEAGTDRDAILEQLYRKDREERVRAFAWLISERLFITPEGAACIIVDAATRDRLDLRDGETEGLVNIPLQIDRVKLSLLLREEEGQFRVSARSKRGWSARKLAQDSFNGGGHEMAAGGKLRWPEDIASPAEAESYVRRVTARFLHEADAGQP